MGKYMYKSTRGQRQLLNMCLLVDREINPFNFSFGLVDISFLSTHFSFCCWRRRHVVIRFESSFFPPTRIRINHFLLIAGIITYFTLYVP